jgi:hypothetical protein
MKYLLLLILVLFIGCSDIISSNNEEYINNYTTPSEITESLQKDTIFNLVKIDTVDDEIVIDTIVQFSFYSDVTAEYRSQVSYFEIIVLSPDIEITGNVIYTESWPNPLYLEDTIPLTLDGILNSFGYTYRNSRLEAIEFTCENYLSSCTYNDDGRLKNSLISMDQDFAIELNFKDTLHIVDHIEYVMGQIDEHYQKDDGTAVNSVFLFNRNSQLGIYSQDYQN